MESRNPQTDILLEAAKLIDNNAIELRLAFENTDGRFYSADKDIENEIINMERTAIQLRDLFSNLN